MTATIAPSQQQSQRQNRQFDTGISDGFSLKIEYRDIVNALLYHGLTTQKFAYAAADFLLQLLREQKHPEWGRLNSEDQRRYIYNTYRGLKQRYQMPFSEDVIRLKIIRPIEKSGLLLTYKPFIHPFIFNHTKAYHVDVELLQNLIKSWKNGEQCAKPTAQSVQSNRTLHSPESNDTFERSIYTINKNKKRERGGDGFSSQKDSDCQHDSSRDSSTQGIQETPTEVKLESGEQQGSEQTAYSAPESDSNQSYSQQELQQFFSEVLEFTSQLPTIKSPEAYTSRIINGLRFGENASYRSFQRWLAGESIAIIFDHLSPAPTNPPATADPPTEQNNGNDRQSSHQSSTSQGTRTSDHKNNDNTNKPYEEWQIKAEDEELINLGYQPGQPYPNFFKWVVQRHCGNNQYTRQQTITYVGKIFKFDYQAVAELWADYKQYLDVQAKQAEEAEQKGMPWWPPSDLKQNPDVPIQRAKNCSQKINGYLLEEQNRLEQTWQQIEAEKGQLPGAGDPQLLEQPEPEEPKLEEPPKENSKEATTAEQPDIATASPADSQNQETQSSPQNEGLISAQAVAEDASENTNAPAQNQEAVETKPEPEEAEPNQPKIPSHLSIEALGKSIENHQSNHRQRKKKFKPHVDKLNKALEVAEQLGNQEYQEQLLELIAHLPEEDYQVIKMPFSLKSLEKWQEIVQKHENQNLSNESSNNSSEDSEEDENCIQQIKKIIKNASGSSSDYMIPRYINQALSEAVNESYKDEILRIARNNLPNYLLNQLEVDF